MDPPPLGAGAEVRPHQPAAAQPLGAVQQGPPRPAVATPVHAAVAGSQGRGHSFPFQLNQTERLKLSLKGDQWPGREEEAASVHGYTGAL